MTTHEEPMDMTPNYDMIPLVDRLAFQRILIEKMIPNYQTLPKEEQYRLSFEWADPESKNHAIKVSAIIDDVKNLEIRELILSGEYDKAAGLIIPLITAEEHEHAMAA